MSGIRLSPCSREMCVRCRIGWADTANTKPPNNEPAFSIVSVRSNIYMPNPAVKSAKIRVRLYATGKGTREYRIIFGRKKVPACPSASTGNPSFIPVCQRGRRKCLIASARMYLNEKLVCQASLVP